MDANAAGMMDLIVYYVVRIGLAVIVYYVGRWLGKLLRGMAERSLVKRDSDEIVVKFVGNLVYVAVMIFTIIAALGVVGIQTASFAAVLAAAGLAVGLALQGSLSNFAAGFLLAIFRPFKTGDFIEAGGATGIVEEIQLFTTQIRTGDNKTVIVPNGGILSGIIVNYSTKPTRRVDFVFGIGYGDDIDKAREVIAGVVGADERVHKDPEPMIVVGELADSSVNFTVRVWADGDDYWPVFFDTTEAVKKKLDEAGVSIPFPQQDVHLYKVDD